MASTTCVLGLARGVWCECSLLFFYFSLQQPREVAVMSPSWAPGLLPLFQGSKVLAKKELAYVPIIGWMWYFTEMVFCSRKWEQDRKTVATSLQHLRDYPEKYFVRRHQSSCVPRAPAGR